MFGYHGYKAYFKIRHRLSDRFNDRSDLSKIYIFGGLFKMTHGYKDHISMDGGCSTPNFLLEFASLHR